MTSRHVTVDCVIIRLYAAYTISPLISRLYFPLILRLYHTVPSTSIVHSSTFPLSTFGFSHIGIHQNFISFCSGRKCHIRSPHSSITSHLSTGVQQFEHIPLTHQASRRYVLYAFVFTFWPKRIVVVYVAGLILKKAWIVMTAPIHIFFICSFILWRLAISNISRTGSSCIRARHNSNHAVIAPLAQNSIAVVIRNPCILARVKHLWQQRRIWEVVV